MYYKVKNVSFRKNGDVFVTAAESNTRPIYYSRYPYATGLEDSIKRIVEFWISVLMGNFQLIKSCKWYQTAHFGHSAYNEVEKEIARLSGMDFIHADFTYRTNFHYEAAKYIAENILLPATKGPLNFDASEFNKWVNAFCARCISQWQKIEEKRKEAHIIAVNSASTLSYKPGYNVYYQANGDRLIISPSKRYDNQGLLDNSQNDAVILPDGSGKFFNRIRFATSETIKELFGIFPQLAF